jgi:hypothetical protein
VLLLLLLLQMASVSARLRGKGLADAAAAVTAPCITSPASILIADTLDRGRVP